MGETAHHIENEAIAFGLTLGSFFFIVTYIISLVFFIRTFASYLFYFPIPICRLQRPEEKCRQARILFQSAGHSVPSPGFCRPEDLFKGRSPHNLPDLFQVLGELDFAAVGSLNLTVAAEYLQCRTYAGKDKIRSANTLALKTFHPVADTFG